MINTTTGGLAVKQPPSHHQYHHLSYLVTTGHQVINTVVTGIPITLDKKYVYRRPLRLKDRKRANSQRVTLQLAHFQARASP